ncbi:MAG: amidohydrolase [Rhodospirillaceae bacterium]|nr:amidohydrolase [Rhodospirillaceae bacterium]
MGTHDDWLALTVEETLEPDLPICDPHHHLWEFKTEYTQPRYLLDEILEDLNAGHNIVSTVFIECGAMFKTDGPEPLKAVGETEFVRGITAMSASGLYSDARVAKGIIGTCDLKIGDAAADVLDAQISAGGGHFKGIRLGMAWDKHDEVSNHRTNPAGDMVLRNDFRAGFKHLAPRNLSYEAWCYHPQIPDVTDLARAFPDTIIILDHFGGPIGIGPYQGKDKEVYAEWQRSIDELALCENVRAKLGGINMEVNGFAWHEKPKPPTSRELCEATRPYYEYTIEKFGVDRCMFESNFPVDKLSCSYNVLYNSFKRLTANYSAEDKAKLYHDVAVTTYKLDD